MNIKGFEELEGLAAEIVTAISGMPAPGEWAREANGDVRGGSIQWVALSPVRLGWRFELSGFGDGGSDIDNVVSGITVVADLSEVEMGAWATSMNNAGAPKPSPIALAILRGWGRSRLALMPTAGNTMAPQPQPRHVWNFEKR